MKYLTYFLILTFMVPSCLASMASLLDVTQVTNDGNVIYLRNLTSGREVVHYATGQATTLNEDDCVRLSPHFDFLANYSLDNPEYLAFIQLTTGTVITQVPWRVEWGDRQDNPLFCSAVNKWVDNTTFRLPGAEDGDQYYDVNISTGVVTGPVDEAATNSELPLPDPSVSELGLGVAATFSPSGNQAIYSQCEQIDCGQTRYVLYDVRQQEVLVELTPPDFSFYYARLIPGQTVFSWSYDEQYIAISSPNSVLAVYDNRRKEWVDLGFLPSVFRGIMRTGGGWNWSPDNTQISFGAQQLTSMGYLFDTGIVTIDLVSRVYYVFELANSDLTNIAWLPSGNGLLIAYAAGGLYRLNFSDGSLQFVDDHVSSIFAWYPTLEPSPVCTVTVAAGDALGLVNAINAANNNGASADTICLEEGTYTFASASNSIALPSITTPITIVGNGATIERGSSAPDFRLFNVTSSGAIFLEDQQAIQRHAHPDASNILVPPIPPVGDGNPLIPSRPVVS